MTPTKPDLSNAFSNKKIKNINLLIVNENSVS